MGRAIGIDLGTTNTCAAVFEDGVPRVITYGEAAAKTIPSVFAIDKSGKRLVGAEAKEQAAIDPLATVIASKRLIGRSFGSQAVEKMNQVFTYELVEGEQSEVLIKVSGQIMTLEQISAEIIKRVKENAENFLGEPVDQAVITVPAYFNDRQRNAVRTAGQLAGLHVLRLLNEPTAAALAYGLGRQLNSRVAIYDLGGGTFDISVIDIKDKLFEVVVTGGDTFLGGVDFDDRVMQHVLKSFLEEHDIDLSFDRVAIARIRDASETAKIELSSQETAKLFLKRIAVDDEDGSPIDLDMTLTREFLESLTMDLVDRSISTVERNLRRAGTTPDELDQLLLVGGQSRMPLVRAKVAQFLGRQPSETVHPDEAVAFGAAIMAASLATKSDTNVRLRDVVPMAIGFARLDGKMEILFQRNEPLPAVMHRELKTSKDNQRSIMLRIYQGDSENIADNELLGSFVFSGLREAPKGEVRLDVACEVDSQGILALTAVDRDTGQEVEAKLKLGEPQGVSKPKRKKKREERSAIPTPLEMPVESSLTAESSEAAKTEAPPARVEPPKAAEPPPATPEPAEEPSASEPAAGGTGLRRKTNLGGNAGKASAPAPQPPAPAEGLIGRLIAWLRGLFGKK